MAGTAVTVVVHDGLVVKLLRPHDEAGRPVRAQSNGRTDDPIPRSLDRHEVDDPSRPHGPGSRYPTGTTPESQAENTHPAGLEQRPSIHDGAKMSA